MTAVSFFDQQIIVCVLLLLKATSWPICLRFWNLLFRLPSLSRYIFLTLFYLPQILQAIMGYKSNPCSYLFYPIPNNNGRSQLDCSSFSFVLALLHFYLMYVVDIQILSYLACHSLTVSWKQSLRRCKAAMSKLTSSFCRLAERAMSFLIS